MSLFISFWPSSKGLIDILMVKIKMAKKTEKKAQKAITAVNKGKKGVKVSIELILN